MSSPTNRPLSSDFFCDFCGERITYGHIWEVVGAPADSELGGVTIAPSGGKTGVPDVGSAVLTPQDEMLSDWVLCVDCNTLFETKRDAELLAKMESKMISAARSHIALAHVKFLHRYGVKKGEGRLRRP